MHVDDGPSANQDIEANNYVMRKIVTDNTSVVTDILRVSDNGKRTAPLTDSREPLAPERRMEGLNMRMLASLA